ncbi:MAG: hypothetical protein LBH25_02910 [Fibromonadaceae bacterium]|jgi:hypothetical protein|nr:hypothetical protein [Fibromonadaceae bacterium]
MCNKIVLILAIAQAVFASPANNKVQEAAYLLKMIADTSKAEELLNSVFVSKNSAPREKLSASLYLAKIAEARGDSSSALKHYEFLKNNAQSESLAYMASEREFSLGGSEKKIKLARHGKPEPSASVELANEESIKDSRFSHCKLEGELYLAQHIVYNCPDKSLRFISKKNGAETWNGLPYTDVFAKVFLTYDGFFLYNENTLSFYKPVDGLNLAWIIPISGVQDMDIRGDKIFVLDIGGNVNLFHKNSGQKNYSVQSDGEALFRAGIGLIGTYQKNGGISVFDSLLNHLWDYQIDGEILDKPILKGDSVIFNLADGNAEILYTRHYRKFFQAIGSNTDSLFSLESGNAYAWYNLALRINSDSAWKRAVIYGSRKREPSNVIFSEYAKNIGAKWVRSLQMHSKIIYPQILSDASGIFIWDAEHQNLFRIFPENGNSGGSIDLPRDKKYEVKGYDPPWLMLYSDFRLSQFSIKEQKAVFLDMPGVPLSFLRNKDSIYIGLMNGFALKYITPKMHLEWSRKVSSAPVFLSLGEAGVYSFSQGKITLLSQKNSGEFSVELSNASHFKSKNGIFAVASEDGMSMQIYSESKFFSLLESFSLPMPVVSLEILENEGKTFVLAGMANQSLSLFELPGGKQAWTFNGRGSAAMQAVQHGSHIWLDQEDSIIALDIGTGKVSKSYKILGSGASILIHGNTLYCATPQKLMYAFPVN